MSFFDEVETTVANTRLLQAVEDSGPISLKYAPIESLQELDQKLRQDLTPLHTFPTTTLANYLFKQHLLAVEDNPDAVSLLNLFDEFRRAVPADRLRKLIKLLALHPPLRPQPDVWKSIVDFAAPKGHTYLDPNHSSSASSSSSSSASSSLAASAASFQATSSMSLATAPNGSAPSSSSSSSPSSSSSNAEIWNVDNIISTLHHSCCCQLSASPALQQLHTQLTAFIQLLQTGVAPTHLTAAVSATTTAGVTAVMTLTTTSGTSSPSSSTNSRLMSPNAGTSSSPRNNNNNNNCNTTNNTTTTTTTNNTNSNDATTTTAASAPAAPVTTTTASSSSSSSSASSPPSLSTVSNASSSTSLRGGPVLSGDMLEGLRVTLASGPLVAPFNSFKSSPLFTKLVQLSDYTSRPVKLEDFRVFRILGRGAFGAVSCVQKLDTHAIFAMKEMGKKQVKFSQSEWMVMNEKKVLSKMKSPFVLNLKYSFHNEESFYLIFDMCSGGDLKYHLREAGGDGRFPLERAKFYAAEVLLGLEFLHSLDIVYRDLKPNNILLDSSGHVKISDLGLTIKLRKNKVLKHLAGTAGYWAPEIVMKTGTYKQSDWWSFGTFLYEMLAGKRPKCTCNKKSNEWCPFGQNRSMEENALKEEGILKLDVTYPPDIFDKHARDLCERLFVVDPKSRLGANGADEIKNHSFFQDIDWEKLSALEVTPPFIPDQRTVYADSIGGVGDMPKGKFKKVKIEAADEASYQGFTYTSIEGVEKELVEALKKIDCPNKDTNQTTNGDSQQDAQGGCCIIL